MSYSYRLKDRLIPKLIPAAVPVVVPLSLASAWAIHACQGMAINLRYYQKRGKTPTEAPPGAGGMERTQDEAIARLPLGEFDPLPIDGYTSTGLRAWTDIGPMFFDSGRILRGRFHRYPHHFHETLIPMSNGTPISGIMGLHHAKLARPGLLIVHGLMNSKRQDLVRVVTLRAFYEWGFNVCAIDLRGFGRSAESVSVPTGAGGIEAGDVIEVIKYLKQFPHFTSIGVLGYSLGGGAVLNAAASKEAEALIDGGVMAVSPPINFEASLARFEEPPEDHEHLLTYHFFKFLLKRSLNHAELMKWVRKRLEKEGGNPRIDGFHDYLRNLAAWGYLGQGREKTRNPDVLLKMLLRLSSPRRALSRIKVPTFILHAKDDPMTRITDEDIALMERVSKSSPHVRCHITERGGHTAYVVVNPNWFYKVVRNYFTYWGKWETVKRHPFSSHHANGGSGPKSNGRNGEAHIPGIDGDGEVRLNGYHDAESTLNGHRAETKLNGHGAGVDHHDGMIEGVHFSGLGNGALKEDGAEGNGHAAGVNGVEATLSLKEELRPILGTLSDLSDELAPLDKPEPPVRAR